MILAVSLTLAGAASLNRSPHPRQGGGGGNKDKHRQDRVRNGEYVCTLAGHFRGSGVARVEDSTVSLSATVTDDSGSTFQLNARDMMVDGPYFATTIGTLGGTSVAVRGRVDASRSSRLTATFVLPGGKGGRIVGKMSPVDDPPDDNWDNDKDHAGNGSGGG
jgi:hypothetical protein